MGATQNLQQVLTVGNDGGSLNVRNPGNLGNTGTGVLRLYTNNDTTDAASTTIDGVQKKVQSSTLRSLNNTGFDAPNGTDTAGFYKIAKDADSRNRLGVDSLTHKKATTHCRHSFQQDKRWSIKTPFLSISQS